VDEVELELSGSEDGELELEVQVDERVGRGYRRTSTPAVSDNPLLIFKYRTLEFDGT
jgi:hypothetical protein